MAKTITSKAKRKWNELSGGQQQAITAATAVQLTLFGLAQIELLKRHRSEVRGPKFLWFLVTFVNYLGPIAFLLFGRRR